MNKIGEITGCAVGTSTTAIGTALQPNQILQTISLVLTIIGTLITIASALYMWFKKAKADGKIDKEEIDEAVEIIQNGVDDVKQVIDENKKKGE